MPKAYDYNGTTSTQIKKIYDYNGTTSTQLKKGYDYNGSASTLIYTNEVQLYPGNTVMGAASGGSWDASAFDAKVIATAGGWAQAYIDVWLTDYSYLKLEFYVYKQGNSQVFVGSSSAFSVKPEDIAGQYVANVYRNITSTNVNQVFTTQMVAVQPPSSVAHIGIQVYTGDTTGAVEAYITKITAFY